jgi:hypothetical protein
MNSFWNIAALNYCGPGRLLHKLARSIAQNGTTPCSVNLHPFEKTLESFKSLLVVADNNLPLIQRRILCSKHGAEWVGSHPGKAERGVGEAGNHRLDPEYRNLGRSAKEIIHFEQRVLRS